MCSHLPSQGRIANLLGTSVTESNVALVVVHVSSPHKGVRRMNFHNPIAGKHAAGNIAVAGQDRLRSRLIGIQANEVADIVILQLRPIDLSCSLRFAETPKDFGRSKLIAHRAKQRGQIAGQCDFLDAIATHRRIPRKHTAVVIRPHSGGKTDLFQIKGAVYARGSGGFPPPANSGDCDRDK